MVPMYFHPGMEFKLTHGPPPLPPAPYGWATGQSGARRPYKPFRRSFFGSRHPSPLPQKKTPMSDTNNNARPPTNSRTVSPPINAHTIAMYKNYILRLAQTTNLLVQKERATHLCSSTLAKLSLRRLLVTTRLNQWQSSTAKLLIPWPESSSSSRYSRCS